MEVKQESEDISSILKNTLNKKPENVGAHFSICNTKDNYSSNLNYLKPINNEVYRQDLKNADSIYHIKQGKLEPQEEIPNKNLTDTQESCFMNIDYVSQLNSEVYLEDIKCEDSKYKIDSGKVEIKEEVPDDNFTIESSFMDRDYLSQLNTEIHLDDVKSEDLQHEIDSDVNKLPSAINHKKIPESPETHNKIQIEKIASPERIGVVEFQTIDCTKRKLYPETSKVELNANKITSTSKINEMNSNHRSNLNKYSKNNEKYIPGSEKEFVMLDINSEVDVSCSNTPFEFNRAEQNIASSDGNYEINQLSQASIINKPKRKWDKKDYCLFCNTEYVKISRHMLKCHQSETEIQEILSLVKGDKRRKHLFNKLRNEGNFHRSIYQENIVPVRKPTQNTQMLTNSTYLPCKFCKGFYKKKFLPKHVKGCPHNSEKEKKLRAASEGQSLYAVYKINDILRKEVFPIMRADEISFTAKTDTLICEVARRFLKNHRDKHFRLVASRKMRQLAALLIQIKKKIKVKNLLSALDPLHFDVLVECTKLISRYDPKTETYGAPSLAVQMGTQLKDCIAVAYNILLRGSYGDQRLEKLMVLKELIVTKWRYEISTIAINDLQQKKWNKPSLIPLAEDLVQLKAYLLRESERCRKILQINPNDHKIFKTLVELCYVQVLVLNRRRAGELQRMTLNSYTHVNNKTSNEFDGCISESEKVLMKSFKRAVIKGKRGRGVPVLFTDEMVKSMNLLLELRENFVLEKNLFLFPNTRTCANICGTKVLYKHARLAGVKHASALTSIRLRKHLATMAQVINLSQQGLEQLATFMGHTSDIHKSHYRLPSDLYQMAKVSKLLLLNERGEASKYHGKSLDEINITLEPIDEGHNEDDGITEPISTDESNHETTAQPQKVKSKANHKGKNRILQPWTRDQRKIVIEYFKEHISKKIPPKKNECLSVKEKHQELLFNKSWQKIKIFIINLYKKD